MTREETLLAVEELAGSHMVSEADVVAAYRRGAGVAGSTPVMSEHHFNLTKVLYGIGGIIVVAGIVFLIQQMWDSFGPLAQVLVTLGSAMALYIAAVLLHQDARWKLVAVVFFVMAAALMPLGIFVTLFNYAPGDNEWLGQLIMAGIPALVYFASYRMFRHPVLLLVAILLSTWSLYAIVGLMLDQSAAGYDFESKVWWYTSLMVGFVYALLGFYFAETDKKVLTGVLYFLGSATALGAGFGLTFVQDPWILFYFILVLGAMYVSTLLRSRSMLIFGALALIGNLTHISFKYFADSLGWPLALIISGFIIIGVGYGTVALNKRFITNTPPVS